MPNERVEASFTCAACGGTFPMGRSDDDAVAELEQNFPGFPTSACDLVCYTAMGFNAGTGKKMTEKMEPALSALEWKEALAWPHGIVDYLVAPAQQVGFGSDSPADLRALIAIANVALPDDDPRKITRHTLWLIRKLREDAYIDAQHPGALQFMREVDALVEGLASYLPPEGQ
jgi:hypothetical protein